jgi:beta propeller repeat protein
MRGTTISVVSVFLVIAALLVSPLIIARATAGVETLITTNATGSDQVAPAISGDWIVWEDTRDGGSDIYTYNVVTGEERRITKAGSWAQSPVISGTRVTWQDYRNGNYDIYLYDLSKLQETRITSDPADQTAPAIDGTKIVWQDLRNGMYDVYLYNITSGREILLSPDTETSDQKYPAISGNLVVWQDNRNGSDDIFLNDTSTGILYNLTPGTLSSDQTKPSIRGTMVVWRDLRTIVRGNIFMNASFETWATSRIDAGPDTATKDHPSIDGTKVVWLDTRNRGPGQYDVFMKDLTGGGDTRITADLAYITAPPDANGYSTGPAISGSRIVWGDERDWERDIYLYTDGVTDSCPVANFTLSAQTGVTPLTIQFTDTSSHFSNPITHWKWEFGDGNQSSKQNPGYIYTLPGNYDVRLTVNNDLCRSETPIQNEYKIVVGTAPVASFNAQPVSGMVPLSVNFSDSSISATSWNWSFGDGVYSEEKNPVHVYPFPGTYMVVLNASNTWGYATTRTTIHALSGVNEKADTMINGITITTPYGSQFLTYDTTKLSQYTNTGSILICTDPALSSHGWKNITFLSGDGIGFKASGTSIQGNISGVIFQTNEINPAGFSVYTGKLSSINYSISLSSYPVGGTVNTRIWEGVLPDDLSNFRKIATLSNFLGVADLGGVPGVAYTIEITKTHFPAGGTVTFHMSVNSSWVARMTDGRDHVYLERIADGRTTGEVLRTRYLYTDPVKNLDYFEANSPRGLSTFGLSLLSGSGNVFQLFTISVASRVLPSGGGGSVPISVQNTQSPEIKPPASPDPGKTAKIYANNDGVVTQETTLQSTDGLAAVIIHEGFVVKDTAGKPLSSITIRAIPEDNLPALPAGSGSAFHGMAYELQPDGATFSPPIAISFTIRQARWGHDYFIKTFDSASGTWEDVPAAYNPDSGVVTAEISHFCYIALFTNAVVPTPPVTIKPASTSVPVIEKLAPSPLSRFLGMIQWVTDTVTKNALIAAAIVILLIALLLFGRRIRRNRAE